MALSRLLWVQDQYPAHQIQAHVPQHGPRYEHKNVPFEGTTTNQDAYKAYAVEPHRAMHAPVVARPYTKFEGTHNYGLSSSSLKVLVFALCFFHFEHFTVGVSCTFFSVNCLRCHFLGVPSLFCLTSPACCAANLCGTPCMSSKRPCMSPMSASAASKYQVPGLLVTPHSWLEGALFGQP